MRVTIQILSGPTTGHRYALSTGQQMTFGRSEECDISFPNDGQMSARHFQLAVDHSGCRIKDLASTNGTQVNNEQIAVAVLQPEDRIQAGNTEFILAVEGASLANPPQPTPAPSTLVPDAPQPTPVPKLKPSVLEGSFLLQTCKSNVKCYRGNTGDSPPQTLASGLSRKGTPVLSLDLSKIDEQYHASAEPRQPLHDWLPDEVQAESPHVLFTLPEQVGDFSVISEAWGKDAVVTIYCPPDEPLPLEQIRRCAGVYCRPSLTRPSLADTTEDQVGDFLKGIDAVLVEDEDPESWVLYSKHDLRETLIGAGLTESAAPESKADSNAGSLPESEG